MFHKQGSNKRHDDKLGLNLLYVIIDLTIIISSIGNITSTCLMYGSSYDKTVTVLLNFAFK